MRPKGTPAELEARRLRAADLLPGGKTTAQVAALLSAGHSNVKKWKAALSKGGRILHDLGFTPQKPEQLARE